MIKEIFCQDVECHSCPILNSMYKGKSGVNYCPIYTFKDRQNTINTILWNLNILFNRI